MTPNVASLLRCIFIPCDSCMRFHGSCLRKQQKKFLLGVNMSRLDALRECSNQEGILHFFISRWPWLPCYSVGDTSEDGCYMKYI